MTTVLAIFLLLLQTANTCLTFRLIKVTGQRLAWLFISAAMLIELGHQIVNVYLLPNAATVPLLLQRQLANAAVLALVMIGLYLLKPLFESLQIAEQLTQQSEAQHRSLMEGSPLALIICQKDQIEYANRAALHILGASHLGELQHRPLTDFVQPDYQTLITEQLHSLTLENLSSPITEIEALRIDRTSVSVEVLAALFLYGGRLLQYIVLSDISERKRRQEALRERETELAHVMRLHTMGEIAAEIAHEVNQPLYAISNFAQASLLHLDSGDPKRITELHKCLEQIHGQAVRAGEIVRNLRNFVGKPDDVFRDVSLHHLIREAIELVSIEARRRKAVIDLLLAPQDITIHANPVQIQQVLVNLLVNACEAMEALPVRDRRVQITTTVAADRAELSVADRGPGLPEEALARVFVPFFSTKSHGMGMGLPVSRTIILNHGGHIRAESNAQGGITFRITLPCA